MQVPFEHNGFCNVHEVPHVPQFALSVCVVAQYAPASPPHVVWPCAHSLAHAPALHTEA